MVGGKVVQVVRQGFRLYVEVLDEDTFDRGWRKILNRCTYIKEGDSLWWQSNVGYLKKQGEESEKCIGGCIDSDGPMSVNPNTPSR